jgi:hypothetical protein
MTFIVLVVPLGAKLAKIEQVGTMVVQSLLWAIMLLTVRLPFPVDRTAGAVEVALLKPVKVRLLIE